LSGYWSKIHPRRFCERLEAVQIARRVINIGGADLLELAFGWPPLDRLIAAEDQA